MMRIYAAVSFCLLSCVQLFAQVDTTARQDSVSVGIDSVASTQPDTLGTGIVSNFDDPFVESLAKLDLESYLEKPSRDFVSLLKDHRHKVRIEPANRHGFRYMAVYTFHEKPYLEIFLFYPTLIYVNPNGISRRKQARQVLREKVEMIQVYNASLCINGCAD
ncbi:MAG TPA: hypothetical protein VFZ78_07020 [Flavisolibacter sp.]